MKSVFIARRCLLRDSDKDGLSPATAAALSALAESGLYTILLGEGTDALARDDAQGQHVPDQRLVDWISEAGGRIDALAHCPHTNGEPCYCWGTRPGLLLEAARDLDVRLEESYLVCDSPTDVIMGYAAECRPLLVLNGRILEDLYGGFQPEPADFSCAMDVAHALDYIACEEESAEHWGHPRPMASLALEEGESVTTWPGDLARSNWPTITAFTPVTSGNIRPVQIIRSGRRLLLLITVGGIWLSLGIAYLLTHLYRVKPFPDFVWYMTLQFIPRPVRGALFILTGVLMLLLALRSLRKTVPALRWGGTSRE